MSQSNNLNHQIGNGSLDDKINTGSFTSGTYFELILKFCIGQKRLNETTDVDPVSKRQRTESPNSLRKGKKQMTEY